MMRIECVRRIQFCAGHRVMLHESKCRNLHGHNYVALFHAEAPDLDQCGRVIDFSVLKEKLGGWIDLHWDHAFIVFEKDLHTRAVLGEFLEWQKQPFVLPHNPTAENMARYLLEVVCPRELKGTDVKVTRIRLFETENCSVEVYGEENPNQLNI